ncbi:hypothetical protein [Pseudomonas typographi]|uniref:Uncharacterized protein n=1 Tax=Pseudomonas typographi TaxID=2715964 RepID=A0ABR7YZS7_9PSED|nr:hypothetical protein [Pseudomonas typographi]MBD1553616.1 hypothetical protein [Pseudomonas typographi]MBD1586703.1 hypothetical protein [Pseudomonas typographi]MBD1598596.1 hypothetical protein [Pseudomonas typographi]
MRYAKGLARWAVGGLIIFLTGNGIGYVGRTYLCQNDEVRVYVAAPGYEALAGTLPEKLYALQVTRCALPEQWGGDREPLEGYP